MRSVILVFAAWAFATLPSSVTLGQTSGDEPVKTSVTANGLVADLYGPTRPATRLPAIIVLGGSEGGLGAGAAHEAGLIAQHGYAVLQVAYFGRARTSQDARARSA